MKMQSNLHLQLDQIQWLIRIFQEVTEIQIYQSSYLCRLIKFLMFDDLASATQAPSKYSVVKCAHHDRASNLFQLLICFFPSASARL